MVKPKKIEVQKGVNRFNEVFMTLMWHPDGTPYSVSDYKKAGMKVPSQAVIRQEQKG